MSNLKNASLFSWDSLNRFFETLYKNFDAAVSDFLSLDALSKLHYLKGFGENIEGIKEVVQIASAVWDYPSQLFLDKFFRYCKGLVTLSLEERQKYIVELGKEKFNKEKVFILNVLQRIEEQEKIDLLLMLLAERLNGSIDDAEYRRLMVLTDRVLYRDLLYLEDHITADPIILRTDSDYGLAASGLLVTAGSAISSFTEDVSDGETGMRFNYTPAAKKLAKIFFGKNCGEATNCGILSAISIAEDDETISLL